MADRDSSFSARLGRALLPLGLVFLVAWFIVTVYGFFAGELEARPLTVLGSIGTFLIILSVIGKVGMSAGAVSRRLLARRRRSSPGVAFGRCRRRSALPRGHASRPSR